MDKKDEAYRKMLDEAIKKSRCIFIYQAHLLPQLMEEISKTGRMTLPTGVRGTLEALITNEQKIQCSGDGVKCVGYDAHYVPFHMTLKYEDNTYKLVAPWGGLFQRSNITDFAAISIWVSEGMNALEFYFRLDGRANEGEPLPLIPMTGDLQEFTETSELLCGHCSIS